VKKKFGCDARSNSTFQSATSARASASPSRPCSYRVERWRQAHQQQHAKLPDAARAPRFAINLYRLDRSHTLFRANRAFRHLV
jgi:hypothetical protein